MATLVALAGRVLLACGLLALLALILQQLFVFNSEFFIRQAGVLAGRIDTDTNDDAANVSELYRRVFARKPSKAEQAVGQAFLAARLKTHPKTAWADYCQAILATSELLIVD